MNKYQMVKFTDNGFELDVRADSKNETVWLTQEEMALLFDVDRTRIIRHVSNVYADGELEKNQHVRKAHKFKKKVRDLLSVQLNFTIST